MRLWSLHPKYLDAKGLVALWREGLLARKVLAGKTRGYKHHPQLLRFRHYRNSIALLDAYLLEVYKESKSRGYHFGREKIGRPAKGIRIPVAKGQLDYECKHLKKKLRKRDRKKYQEICDITVIRCHPLFKAAAGDIEAWEKR